VRTFCVNGTMCKFKTFRLKSRFAERLDGIAPPLKCSLINFLKAREKFQRGKKLSAAEEVKLSSRSYWSCAKKFELSEIVFST